MSNTYVVYKGFDNVFTVQLCENDIPVDLGGTLKVDLLFKGTHYDSDVYPNSFDWSAGNGYLSFKLGIISTIDLGRDNAAELIIYDASNPNGVMWGKMYIHVKQIS